MCLHACGLRSFAAMETFFFFILVSSTFAAAQTERRCPNEWIYFENSCYVFLDEVAPWTTARVFCSILNPNSRLLEVSSKSENDFITAQIKGRSGVTAVWQGINDLIREGRWVYNSNGQEISYTNWSPGEPNNNMGHENGEDCVIIHTDGTWDDLWCEDYDRGYRPSPVCEVDATEEELVG